MELPPFLAFLMARPFRPFEVRLVDGHRVKIVHPESVTVYLGGLGFWHVLPSGKMEFIEGNAMASIRSAGVVDSSDFIRE